jgi:hypothetical protein
LRPLTPLLQFDCTLGFDNIVNSDPKAPKRLNNGVLLAKKQARFVHLWIEQYARFNPLSFDYDSRHTHTHTHFLSTLYLYFKIKFL